MRKLEAYYFHTHKSDSKILVYKGQEIIYFQGPLKGMANQVPYGVVVGFIRSKPQRVGDTGSLEKVKVRPLNLKEQGEVRKILSRKKYRLFGKRRLVGLINFW